MIDPRCCLVPGVLALACAGGPEPLPTRAPATAPPSASASAAAPPAEPRSPAPRAVNAGSCPTQALIDDGEDGDALILAADQRNGNWITYADEAGSTMDPRPGSPFTMADGGAHGSGKAARMHGKMAEHGSVWVGMGVVLTSPSGPYDVACCKGIAFWAKKAGPGTSTVRFKIGDGDTVEAGGVCEKCFNDFGIDLGFTAEWQEYTVPFDRLRQQGGWGDQFPAFRPEAIYHLHWQVNHPHFDYDIWVDDVRLVGCAG